MWGLVSVYEEMKDKEPGMYWSGQIWDISVYTHSEQLGLSLLTPWVPASTTLVELSWGALRGLSSVGINIYCLNLLSIRSHPEGPVTPTDILLN